MKPHIAEAECARAEVVALKEKLKALKAIKTADSQDEHIEALETEIWERERAAREAQAAADAIDMAVFDLKAVNPNAVLKVDTRTSAEVIQSIEDHGKIVARALEALRTLLQA
jgi:type I restriction enzyme M protein